MLDRRADRVESRCARPRAAAASTSARASRRLRRRRRAPFARGCRSRSTAGPRRSAGSSSTRSSTARCARFRTRTSSAVASSRSSRCRCPRDGTAGNGCCGPGQDAAPFLEPEAVRRAVEPWLDGETRRDRARGRLHLPHPHGRALARRAGCCSPATPRTSCRRSPGRASRLGPAMPANLAWKLAAVLTGAPGRAAGQLRARAPAARHGDAATGQSDGRARPGDGREAHPGARPVPQNDRRHRGPEPAGGEPQAVAHVRRRRVRRPAGEAPSAAHGRIAVPADRSPRRPPAGSGWAAVTIDERRAQPRSAAEGLRVVDPGADGAWLRKRGLTLGGSAARPVRLRRRHSRRRRPRVPRTAPRHRVRRCPRPRRERAASRKGSADAMIALIGATGRIGRHVAEGLSEAGADARALVRDPPRPVCRSRSCGPISAEPATLRRRARGRPAPATAHASRTASRTCSRRRRSTPPWLPASRTSSRSPAAPRRSGRTG